MPAPFIKGLAAADGTVLRPTIRDVGQDLKETVIHFFTKNSDELAEGAETADDVGDAGKAYTPTKGGGGSTRKIVKGNTSVTFGHGGRHFDDIPNANISEIEETIAEHVYKNPPKIGESPRVTIDINGISVEYRPFNLGDGRINIGTYIPRN